MTEEKKYSILIIDEDPIYLEIINLGLNDEFDILTVAGYQNIRAEALGMEPSIILIGENLGESNAEDIINSIQSLTSFDDIPILALENNQRKDLAPKGYFEKYFFKPRSFQEIRERLHSILKSN